MMESSEKISEIQEKDIDLLLRLEIVKSNLAIIEDLHNKSKNFENQLLTQNIPSNPNDLLDQQAEVNENLLRAKEELAKELEEIKKLAGDFPNENLLNQQDKSILNKIIKFCERIFNRDYVQGSSSGTERIDKGFNLTNISGEIQELDKLNTEIIEILKTAGVDQELLRNIQNQADASGQSKQIQSDHLIAKLEQAKYVQQVLQPNQQRTQQHQFTLEEVRNALDSVQQQKNQSIIGQMLEANNAIQENLTAREGILTEMRKALESCAEEDDKQKQAIDEFVAENSQIKEILEHRENALKVVLEAHEQGNGIIPDKERGIPEPNVHGNQLHVSIPSDVTNQLSSCSQAARTENNPQSQSVPNVGNSSGIAIGGK